MATRAGLEGRTRLTVHTSLTRMSKADFLHAGPSLGLDDAITTSCHDPSPAATSAPGVTPASCT
jgi:7-cyano-7-deazaguanine synthase